MRVLHVIPALAPRYGGPSAAAIGICRALGDAGVATLLAATDADGQGHLDVARDRVETFSGVPTIFFRKQASEAFKWSKPLKDWVNANVAGFDLVHIHAVFSHSSIAAGRACRTHGVPYLVRPLGTLDPWSVNRKRLRKQILFRLGVTDLLSGASGMHYTSREELRLAESVVPGLRHGTVVPLGIDDECFTAPHPQVPSSAPYLLSLSRVHEKKGLEVLIGAFHSLAVDPRLRDWRLVIAGDGTPAYVASLKELASRGAGKERIGFRGWVEGAGKRALVRDARLVVSASHQENFGISVLEAMASNVPAFVTPGFNLAGEIHAVGAGWIAEQDKTAFTRLLGDAMRDTRELHCRGLRAGTFAAQFRWPVIAERLQAMYTATVL